MPPRGSQHDQDEISWSTTGVRLGTAGLDLRQPSDPGALTELLNARFSDDRTVEERPGHTGILLRDSSDFAALGPNYAVGDQWVYGHGMRVSSTNALGWENAHHPILCQGRGTFNFEGSDVVWTGDRLLVARDEGACIGESAFWQRSTVGAALARGIPAYLPLQTDSEPPASVSGDYVETCLTDDLRVYVATGTGGLLNAWILDRATGAILNTSEISGASNDPVEPKVLNSGGTIVVLWRDYTTRVLYKNWWTGIQWAGATSVAADVYGYDVAQVDGGFHVLWRVGSPSTVALKVGRYQQQTAQATPYAFGTALNLTGITPNGPLALGVSPTGELGVACSATGLYMRVFQSSGLTIPGIGWTVLNAGTGWDGGIAITSRGLKESNGYHDWVVHAARTNATGVIIRSAHVVQGTGLTLDTAAVVRYNSVLASKSFRVGDEVFCWLRADNAGTHYLVGGVVAPQVCGYADREEAAGRVLHDGNYALPHVLPDPLDASSFTWARPFSTGQAYSRGGNVRVGDLNFLPEMTPVQFGRSVYLSGSAVRNWDGVQLGDAGWQDYPKITNVAQSTGGYLTALATHYIRVYAVRYNAVGERFQSAAQTYGPVVLTGSNNRLALTIATLPDTNHSDVSFEVWVTENLGTTFYLDGTVANSLNAATVSYTVSMDDVTRITKAADPHAAGVGAVSELEEWGPLGCSMLAVSGDRLWGAGGQVPSGTVQFSKLREQGEGAGFDDLAGFQVVDTEGAAVTSVTRLNDATVAFQANRLNVIVGTGPDNYGRGGFTIPQIVLADGATTHAGTAVTQVGAVFWGQKGPRLLTNQFKVENISAPVRPLSETLAPSGVRVDLSRQEVVWYTSAGDALLWNYLGDTSRWARWDGLPIAGCSDGSLITTDGRLLRDAENAVGDDGQSIIFTWTSGNLRAEQILAGHSLLGRVGVLGQYLGPHSLRIRVFFNGSPMWTDEWVWQPETETWLTAGNDLSTLTPAQIDALATVDRSGAYMTHKRTSRQTCSFFRVEVSNMGSDGKTYVPYELSLELGSRGGLARVPVNTFTTSVGR